LATAFLCFVCIIGGAFAIAPGLMCQLLPHFAAAMILKKLLRDTVLIARYGYLAANV